MRIARVSIQNSRCFSSGGQWALDWLPNGDLNLLIGPNGAGKTALVDAIDLVLNWEGQRNRALVTEYDFPCCDTKKAIRIEVTLVDIGIAIAKFGNDIQFLDKKTYSPIDERDEEPDDARHEPGVVIRFEAKLDEEEGEIRCSWILPKLAETDYQDRTELSRSQHEAIGYFRIQPSISAGAFTLGEYSTLGRHLKRLKYKLGRLPDQLKPAQTLPECKWDCENCEDKKSCTNEVEGGDEETLQARPLGKMLDGVADNAKSMLGTNTWRGMKNSLGPRYGGLRTTLAATTFGLRSSQPEVDGFIPFERLSAGERYALSFALATTRLKGSSTPIIIMEEPETALYPAAIGQIMASLQAKNSPQVIVTSHSEAVVRRFGVQHVFRMNLPQSPEKLSTIATEPAAMRELEKLIMPGATSVLFVDKVLVVEGGGDAFASGVLDRLSGAVSSDGAEQNSLASLGWSVLNANRAGNVPGTVDVLKRLGVKVAALFDADEPGKNNAEKTKDKCPVFTYKSTQGSDITLELALFHGLDQQANMNARRAFQKYPACAECNQGDNVANCVTKNGCLVSVTKNVLKEELRDCCLEQYRQSKSFPRAFTLLLERLDTATPGDVVTLDVDCQQG